MVAEALADIGNKDVQSIAISETATSLAGGASVNRVPKEPSTGKRIVVTSIGQLHLQLAYGADVSAQFKSDTTALTGVIRFTNTNNNLNIDYMPDGIFRTAIDEDLVVTIKNERASGTTTSTATGWMNYYEE